MGISRVGAQPQSFRADEILRLAPETKNILFDSRSCYQRRNFSAPQTETLSVMPYSMTVTHHNHSGLRMVVNTNKEELRIRHK